MAPFSDLLASPLSEGPFHEGEIAMQLQIGVREAADGIKQMIKPSLKPGHAEFFSERSEAFVSSVDPEGRPWASVVFHDPGFAHALNPSEVVLDGGIHPWDPLYDNAAKEGSPLGFLFIELATRRRNRMNGVSAPKKAPMRGLHVDVKESFGNCPKYIQRRVANGHAAQEGQKPLWEELHKKRPALSTELTPGQMQLISQADFLTIATAASGGRGADMSHRGGRPGFVRVSSPTDLWFPDYRGNNLFNTLGNIMTNRRAGFLFIDWKRRTTIQLTGRAEVVFKDELLQQELSDQFEASNCVVHFHLEAALETPDAVPYAYDFVEYSPASPEVVPSGKLVASSLGSEKGAALGQSKVATYGLVEVTAVKRVARDILDFQFQAPFPVTYRAGQYASFNLAIPAPDGTIQKVERSWTISSAPSEPAGHDFHISVKHKPGGLASTWLHQQVRCGTTVHFAGADGVFTIFDPSGKQPEGKFLFLSAGVGITPMLSMLRGLRSLPPPPSPASSDPPLDVIFFHSSRTLEEIPFLEELSAEYAARPDVNVRFVFNLSKMDSAPSEATGFELLKGRLSRAMLGSHVPELQERQIYLCGPDGYMADAEAMLLDAGADPAAIHTEAFYF